MKNSENESKNTNQINRRIVYLKYEMIVGPQYYKKVVLTLKEIYKFTSAYQRSNGKFLYVIFFANNSRPPISEIEERRLLDSLEFAISSDFSKRIKYKNTVDPLKLFVAHTNVVKTLKFILGPNYAVFFKQKEKNKIVEENNV